MVLDIDGAIGPAMADYVVRELRAATPNQVGVVVLRMNTPGGLDTSMREIISAILASPVPVVDLRGAERRARRQRRHLYRLCERDRRHGAGHQYRRRDPGCSSAADPLPGGSAEQKQSQQDKTGEPATPKRARSSTTPSPISAASPRSTAATPIGPPTPCARRRAFPPPTR